MPNIKVLAVKLGDMEGNILTPDEFIISLTVSDYNHITRTSTTYDIEFTGAQLLSTPALDKPIKVKGREEPLQFYKIHKFVWLAGLLVRKMLFEEIISKEEYLSFLFDHLRSNYLRLNRDFGNISDTIAAKYYAHYAPAEVIHKYKDSGGFSAFITNVSAKYKYHTFEAAEIPDQSCVEVQGGNFVGCYYDDEYRIRPIHEKKHRVLCNWALFYLAIKDELKNAENNPA